FFQERYQRIREEFHNLSDLELQTFKLTDEEMIEDIRKLDYITFREVNFEDSDALMLTEPMLSAHFRKQVRLHRLKYPHEETQVQDNNEPTRYYYHNHITDQYTAEQHLRNETVTYTSDGTREVTYSSKLIWKDIFNIFQH
ncbi:MAG: hypothetical protein EZS28_024484, partial [Streblomastix strix]